jgi:predicted acylesterase/phospholipase RssA
MHMETQNVDVVVIGAGIAGSTAAAALAPDRRVALIEAEEAVGYHTSGRSAATWILNYGPPDVQALTGASRAFLQAPPPGFAEHPLLTLRGVLYLADAVPRALFTIGRPARETMAIRSLIRYRTNIGRFEAQLGRKGFVLSDIPSQTVLVLQGGGAMGAFECGVVKALEQFEVHPDIVAGVSIGAFNGAIVASHPRHATEALEAFWHDLAVASPLLADERLRQFWSSLAIMAFGVPRFFTPRWWSLEPDDWTHAWTSVYDHRPVRKLLEQYVDFAALKSSPVRLLVSAVDVETAQLEVFDSYVGDFTVDHLLASGSLPPGLPWTTIGGRHYWDGGIVSNSPLDHVVERCGAAGKRVIVVESRGGLYSDGPAKVMDFQEPYLRTLLGFIGLTDVTFIHAEKIGFGPEAREAALASAKQALAAAA